MTGSGIRGTLHGVSLSPYVRKVRAVLALKGIDYELVNVMPGAMDAEFRARSPLSKIPVWEEAGWTLPDSSAICAYLERVQPEPALYPADPKLYATALFWEEYADTRLVEFSNPIFFQRIVRTRVFDQACDEEIVRRHQEEVLPPVFDQIETLFIGGVIGGVSGGVTERGGPAQAGEVPLTIATLSMWSPLVNLAHAGVEIDAASWPGLAAFLADMNAHPVLQKIVDRERAALKAH